MKITYVVIITILTLMGLDSTGLQTAVEEQIFNLSGSETGHDVLVTSLFVARSIYFAPIRT